MENTFLYIILWLFLCRVLCNWMLDHDESFLVSSVVLGADMWTTNWPICHPYTTLFILFGDLSTEAFLAALKRFASRRGLPSAIHTDNGTNFVGARNDLQELYRLLASTDTQASINSFLLAHGITSQRELHILEASGRQL